MSEATEVERLVVRWSFVGGGGAAQGAAAWAERLAGPGAIGTVEVVGRFGQAQGRVDEIVARARLRAEAALVQLEPGRALRVDEVEVTTEVDPGDVEGSAARLADLLVEQARRARAAPR